MLNETPLVSLLELQHDEYLYFRNTWQTISDIREGAIAITKKIEKYLPRRPNEALDLYQLRLNKASWTPVMSTAIREFVVKMLASPIHIEGVEGDFWAKFKDDTNGKGRDESDLLTQMFSCMLYYGRVFVAVDRPVLKVSPRSLLEERLNAALPKVAVYEPLSVINWGDDWYVTREIKQVNGILEKPKTLATWRIWTTESIYTYQSEVKLDNLLVTHVKVGDYYYTVSSPEATASLVSKVDHRMGKNPMVRHDLSNDLWTGNNCYLKQLQHFAIESSWTDAGIMAGTIQRIFTPTPPLPTNDPTAVFEEPDYSDIKADNAHILIGNGFQFVESSGNAIASLTSQLETIENQIRAIVSMTSNNVTKGSLEQSGASKAIDREPLEATMKAYGARVAALYQDVLQRVALAANQSAEIVVNGLDSYSVDTLTDMLEQTALILPSAQVLPKTALKLWFGKLANLIAGSRSATLDNLINDELATLWDGAMPAVLIPTEPTEENVK